MAGANVFALVCIVIAGVPTYTTTPYLVSPQDPAVYGMSLTGINGFLYIVLRHFCYV